MVDDKASALWTMSEEAVKDSERWFGDTAIVHSIPHNTLALCGEAGELANIVKKIERGSLDIMQPAVRYELMMEIVDVFTYTLNLAGLTKTDLLKAYYHKRGENEQRFMAQRAQREARVNGS